MFSLCVRIIYMCSYCSTKVYFNHFQMFCCSFAEAVILHFKRTCKQPSVDFVWVYALSSFKKHEHNGGLRVSRKIKSTMQYLLFGLSKHPLLPHQFERKNRWWMTACSFFIVSGWILIFLFFNKITKKSCWREIFSSRHKPEV